MADSDAKVSLREVVDGLDMASSEISVYLHKPSGKVLPVQHEHLQKAEEDDDPDLHDWERERVEEARAVLNSEEYVELPSQYDIHEWNIMQDYCHTLSNERLKNLLLDQIHRKGAFSQFKNTLHHLGDIEDWYRFRAEAFKEIAVRWLERHQIAYVDDVIKKG